MKKAEDIWRDPVWSKVIASVVIAAATGVVAIWPPLSEVLWKIGILLGAKTPVWNWLIVVACLLPCLLLVALLVVSLRLHAAKASDALYREDVFLGVTWRWTYKNSEIVGLHCLCRKCGLQVYFRDVGAYASEPRFIAKCDDCGNLSDTFDGDLGKINNFVVRLVHRNLRRGEWNKTVKEV